MVCGSFGRCKTLSETPKPKPLKQGSYVMEAGKLETLREFGRVIPYKEIKKAIAEGKSFVLKAGVNRSTVKQAMTRLADNYDTRVELRKHSETGQFVYIPA